MSTVKATRVTLVVDEGWMEVLHNHHSVVEPGEVFTWESSEPVEVEWAVETAKEHLTPVASSATV